MRTYGCGTFRLLLTAFFVPLLAHVAIGSQERRRIVSPAPQAAPPSAASSPQEAFVPALEIPDAVYVRLGNEMLAALADSIPSLMPADAMTGFLPDVQQTTASEGMTVNVQFSGISYSGRVTRVLMEAKGEDVVNVTVALRDIRLVFSRTYLSGEFFSASCGPLTIVLGHRADLPLSFQVRPVVEQGKLRLKLLATQFRLSPDNWTVGSPAWVNVSGFFSLFVGEGRIVQGLRDGIYRDSSRIEREVAGSVPRMLARLENRFTLEPTEQIVVGLWPLPVYKPALRSWPSFVRTDSTGITVGLGVSVAAVDPRNAPAQPKRVEMSGSENVRLVTGEKFQLGVAPGLMEPLSAQVVSDDAARAQVPDMPMEKLQPLGDPKALGEIIPDLKGRGDREVRAEMRLASPIKLHRAERDAADAIVFELPKVRCDIDVHPKPDSDKWVPYLEIDFRLRQTAKPEVASPSATTRVLSLNWQGTVAIEAQARFAPGYSPSDDKIDVDRIHQILTEAWQEWTSTGPLAQVNLDDLDLGFSKLRAQSTDWEGAYLATSYGPAGVEIRNLADKPIAYEMKGPYSPWGGPYSLEPGQGHSFSIAYPVTCRFQVGSAKREYTLPPGSNFEFQRDPSGQPDLFISREGPAAGAVSVLEIPKDVNSANPTAIAGISPAYPLFLIHLPVAMLPQ